MCREARKKVDDSFEVRCFGMGEWRVWEKDTKVEGAGLGGFRPVLGTYGPSGLACKAVSEILLL